MSRIGERAPTFLGHPRGLAILFLTEMWERFSYYGMRALLILYLTQHFLLSDARATVLYGAYAALVFVMTILGGVLADRYLGTRKAVTFGAILLLAGHFGMAFEGEGARQIITHEGREYRLMLDGRGGDAMSILMSADASSPVRIAPEGLYVSRPEAIGSPDFMPRGDYVDRVKTEPLYLNILYLSLALIITGVGFLKANISTMVGALYGLDDPRRDSGFTLFYMGINLGAFFAAILCGWLGLTYGWKYGFGLAGLGMGLGLAVFLWGQRWLRGLAEPQDPIALARPILLGLNREHLCYLAGLGMIGLSMALVVNAEVVGGVLAPLGALMLVLLTGYAVFKCRGDERRRMLAAIYFLLAQIPFWALFEQAGSSLNLLADRLVDRNFLGWIIPAPMFQGLGAGMLFILAPLMAWLWIRLGRGGREPSAAVKFALGVLMAGLGFLVLSGGVAGADGTALVPLVFLVLIYLFLTVGELLVSPVGLAAVTRLAPARIVGATMGAWFLYTGISSFLAGFIARSAGAETLGGRITDPLAAKQTYVAVYGQIGWLGVVIALVMLVVAPLIGRLMRSSGPVSSGTAVS